MPQPRSLFFFFVIVVGVLAVTTGYSATWTIDASVTNEVDNNLTEEGSDRTHTIDQSYTISYEHEINPSLLFFLEFALDITDEKNDGPEAGDDFDTLEVTPSLDLELQAVWWDLDASWERSKQSSTEEDQETTVETTWELEYIAEPASEAAPAGGFTYQRDKDEEAGITQTIEEDLDAGVDYSFWNILEFTFDVTKETTDDKVNPDSDTEGRAYDLEITFDYEFRDVLKLEADWTNERDQAVLLSDKDDVLAREDTLDNNVRALITYNVLEDLELTLEREVDWDKDLEQDTLEVTDTTTGEVSYSAVFTDNFGIDLFYGEEREDNRGTESDSYIVTRDYEASFEYSPIPNISFIPSYDRSDEDEDFDDPELEDGDTVDEEWEVELDASFWYDQVEISVARTFTTTKEQGEKTTDEKDWDIDLLLAFVGIPNLELSPEFTFTETQDKIQHTVDTEKEFEVGVDYDLSLNDVLTLSLSHTYTRISKDPDEGVSTIERQDDTDIVLTWDNFLEGMVLEFDFTRQADDESKDDKEAVVDYTYGVTYDWDILEQYVVSVEYTYDQLGDSEDTQNVQTTFSMEFFEDRIIVDFEYEFDEQLEGDKDQTHRYLIEIQGQF
jgi:hypothetical protein